MCHMCAGLHQCSRSNHFVKPWSFWAASLASPTTIDYLKSKEWPQNMMTSMRLYIHFGELHGQFMMESTLQCPLMQNRSANNLLWPLCKHVQTITTAPELGPSVPKCTALCSPLSCRPSFDRFLFGVLWNDVALKSVATESKANHMVALTNSKSYI
jgi:hypothetical protein